MSVKGQADSSSFGVDFQETKFQIMGISLPIFLLLTAVVLGGTFMGALPLGMVGAFALMFILGAILDLTGNKLPIIKDYLGGGPIVIIFASAALVTYGVLPAGASDTVKTFMTSGGFLDFYIAALITGSMLGMKRDLLIKAAVRYLPAILGGVVVSLGLVALFGTILGYGAKEAVLFIGIPIMGGGMGAGAVPLAKIFGGGMGKDATEMLSIMVPAVALGNAMAIVAGGLLDKLGRVIPSLTGNGELMRTNVQDDTVAVETEEKPVDYAILGIGLLIATAFFTWGAIVGKLIPSVHAYAWMIITVALVKSFGLLPKRYEESCAEWFQFVMKNFTAVLLVGIGIAYTDLNQVFGVISIDYVILVAATVIGAILGSGFVGRFVGFNPIESSITAGLCMANMGGTGDVAVLSAAKRMSLMPFAQISSRLGGAFILILASVVLKFFG